MLIHCTAPEQTDSQTTSRRQALRQLASLALAPAALGLGATAAQAARNANAGLRIVQLADTASTQQDISRDYALGYRLAWADAGRAPVALASLTLDSSGADGQDPQRTLRELRDDPSVVALGGTVGEQLALDCISVCQSNGATLGHIAPWMADSRYDNAAQVLPLFASRDEQLRQVLSSLRQVGHSSFGVVYPSRAAQAQLEPQMQSLAARLQLPLRGYAPATPFDLAGLAAALSPDTPPLLIMLCSTLDLASFKRALDARAMVRSLVCLADTNPAELKQLNALGGRSSIIVTQVVADPVHDMQPVTQRYRSLLTRLYEEAPTPMSFAGFLAGRYTLELLKQIDGPLSRAAVLDALRARPSINLGGVTVDYRNQPRGLGLVTTTRLSADGKLHG